MTTFSEENEGTAPKSMVRLDKLQAARKAQEEALAVARANQPPKQVWVECLGRHFVRGTGKRRQS